MATKTPSQSGLSRYADPAVLMRIRSLDLRVRSVMDGFYNGLHKSPLHGFSVEFSEYRQYTDGDDPRFIDWKIVARSDRYFIKLFEDETNLRCHLVVDNSRSMSFGTTQTDAGNTYTKADYAKTLAGCLAYALIEQRDAAGLVVFDEEVDEYIPARFRHGQLRQIYQALEKAEGGKSTDLTKPLERVAGQMRKRGMVIVISDFLAPIDGLERDLGYLASSGHELVVFQVLDPQEVNFEFDEPALFTDLETGEQRYIDPDQSRASYRMKLEEHLARVKKTCEKLGAVYELTTTDRPLELALTEFFVRRQHQRSSHGRVAARRGRNSGRAG
ncbi:MAG: DUF58 domain-containing protein [Planctomycetota bacterium]|nr:DUF58 domain-containing protein [Planctomycetota bacterium]MDA1251745.1 DUF58 domain-containing protein [Planctomycetota bacterium]